MCACTCVHLARLDQKLPFHYREFAAFRMTWVCDVPLIGWSFELAGYSMTSLPHLAFVCSGCGSAVKYSFRRTDLTLSKTEFSDLVKEWSSYHSMKFGKIKHYALDITLHWFSILPNLLTKLTFRRNKDLFTCSSNKAKTCEWMPYHGSCINPPWQRRGNGT